MYRFLSASAVVMAFAIANASGPASAQDAHELDTTMIELGEALYMARCATCHGADATGNGPTAAALVTPPPDLTQISKRAGGHFPAARVVEIITYGGSITAHGSGPMPVWGREFSDEGGRGKIGASRSRQAIIALKRYLETIQK